MAKTISYKRLWKLLIDRDMTRQDLKTKTGISTASIAKLGKGENITTGVLIKICDGLNCDLTEIMELIEDVDSEMGSDSTREPLDSHGRSDLCNDA